MSRTVSLAGRLLALAWLSVSAAVVRAEVSATPRSDGKADFLIMRDLGITDGVDPIPQFWKEYRPLPADFVLNPTGELRGDGRPDVAFVPGSAWPVVVWSFVRAGNRDVAVALWQGNAWGAVGFLTSTPENELDPRVFVQDDGAIHVVWWVEGPDTRVELATLSAAGEVWQATKRVNPLGEPGRRPSVAVHAGTLWVAYERDATQSAFDTSEIAVRREDDAGSFELEYVAGAEYDGPLEPVLHARKNKLWMDWRHSADLFAYATIAEETVPPRVEFWSDHSWVGVETVRRLIAQLVAASVPGDPGAGDAEPLP